MTTMRERFVASVGDLMDRDDRVAVVLAVISSGMFEQAGITARHPDRVFDVGIREQAQIGIAGGLALEGYLPIVTGYAPFLVERPFEQIKLSLGHQGARAILASVGASFDSAASGRTHHAPEDVQVMASLPGWTVHVPGHPDEVASLVAAAHSHDESTYIRLSTATNTRRHAEAPARIAVLRRGTAMAPTVLAVGPVADNVLAAAEGLDVTVLYTTTPNPLDEQALRGAARSDRLVVVEPYLAGTSAGPVTRAFAHRAMQYRFHGVTDPELRRYGTPGEHRVAQGLDPAGIRSVIADIGRAA